MLDWRDNILAIAIRAIYRYNVLLVVGHLPPFDCYVWDLRTSRCAAV